MEKQEEIKLNTTLKKVRGFLRRVPDHIPLNLIITDAAKGDIRWPYKIPLDDVIYYLKVNNNQLP